MADQRALYPVDKMAHINHIIVLTRDKVNPHYFTCQLGVPVPEKQKTALDMDLLAIIGQSPIPPSLTFCEND
jgi:hypothetical protein